MPCAVFSLSLLFHFFLFSLLIFFLGRHFTLIPKSCKSSFSFFCVLAFFSFSIYVFLLLVLIYISFSAFWHNRVRCFYKVEKNLRIAINFVFIYLKINVQCEESLTLWEFLPHFSCLSISLARSFFLLPSYKFKERKKNVWWGKNVLAILITP